jgi:hypothetical protein
VTISSQTRKAGPFVGNDSSTAFPFAFKVFQASDLLVVRANSAGVESVLVLNTDYTVSLNADQNSNPGGTVTLGAALATGTTLVLTSSLQYLQPTDLTNQGGFYPKVITDALDRATIQIQQLADGVSRAAKLPITNTEDADALTADIVRLADSADNIDTVASNIADVNTVAGDIADVTTVAGIADDVSAVASIAANVTTVAGNTTNVNTVAGIDDDVTTVAGIAADVTTVAGIAADVSAVADIAADVSTVADNIADVNNYADTYLGGKNAAPSTRNDGSPLQSGDMYFDTTDDSMKVWRSTYWSPTYATGAISRSTFTATAGQTVFSVPTYTVGANTLAVFVNGVKLLQGTDYTETDANTVTLAAGATVGDDVEVEVMQPLAFGEVAANQVTASDGSSGSLWATVQGFINKIISSTGSAVVGYTPSATGAQTTNLSAYLNLKTLGLKATFGAVGDGVTSDYTKLASALTTTGKILEIEDGTYYYNSNLPAPTVSAIVGHGELVAKLKPGASVTKGLSIGGANYPSQLLNFQIDGSLTTNATGAFFGDAGSCAVGVNGLRVLNFTGASGVGVRIGDVLKSKFEKVTAGGNGIGLLTQKVSSGFPTTTYFDTCVFTDNATKGAKIIDGQTLIFTNTDFESSGEEGTYILPASGGDVRPIVFDYCWWEDNYNGNTSKYHLVAGDGSVSAQCHLAFYSPRFGVNGSTAKAAQFNGSAISFVVQNPVLASPVTDSFNVINGAYGNFPDWVRQSGMTFSTVVTDASNKASNADGAGWRTWTPTFSDGASTGFTGTPTLTTNGYKLNGATVDFSIDWTATLAGAGTPQWIRCTVPTNLTPAANSTVLGWLSIGGVWQAGMCVVDTGGYIYFRKIDSSNFAAGSTITFRAALAYRVA